MAKLCNAAFFRAQPLGTGRNFTRPVVTRRLQSLLCCAARALFRLKSVIVVGAKQVLTGPRSLEGEITGEKLSIRYSASPIFMISYHPASGPATFEILSLLGRGSCKSSVPDGATICRIPALEEIDYPRARKFESPGFVLKCFFP
jgi:hypothetical protein